MEMMFLLLSSVFTEPSMGTVKRRFMDFRQWAMWETRSVCVRILFLIKMSLWAVCRVESTMRRCWRMWRPTPHATWRRWRPFSSSRRRRRGRGSASWSRPSSPSTGIWTSPTMRGEESPGKTMLTLASMMLLLSPPFSCFYGPFT